jgi:hypothetical protein
METVFGWSTIEAAVFLAPAETAFFRLSRNA